MEKGTCEVCGGKSQLELVIEDRPIVPREVSEQAGQLKTKIARLCANCQKELTGWYLSTVADTTFDTKVNRFRAKSPLEMVKEYETAYRRFAQYKKQEKRKIA